MLSLLVERWLSAFGLQVAQTYTATKGLRRFWSDYAKIRKLNSISGSRWVLRPNYPCLTDFHDQSGTAHGHYFYQDLLIAQRIFERKPQTHVDVGSRIDGFVAHVASFRRIEVLDIREQRSVVPNIVFRSCDLLNLPPQFHEYCDSVSCLHVLEHIGLGRYGDRIDLDGHKKGITSLQKMLKPGGTLYLSVPFGTERIEYNAHRVFDLKAIVNSLEPAFQILELSIVDDHGDLYTAVDLKSTLHFAGNCRFSLAIFGLRKRGN